VRGIVRPCRSHLGPELSARWQAHLCGLCLTLRDVAGQPQRVLTGYDVLLLSVLVEAQAGSVETTTAAPCPLRGFTRATVVASTSDAAQLAAAGALLGAGAGLVDKADDGDLPAPARGPARRVAGHLSRTGTALAERLGLDPSAVLGAPAAAAAAERDPAAGLRALLAPTGEAVASLFAHTAEVAGRPDNAAPLADAGRAFGMLVHLLDAAEDREDDVRGSAFNPLVATGTDDAAARVLAEQLAEDVGYALCRAELEDRSLVDVLLGAELRAAVRRTLGPVVPAQRTSTGALAVGLAAWALVSNAVFVGGGGWNSGGGGGCGPRRRGYRGYPPPGYGRGYPPPGYGGYGGGYRRVGPSCGEMLACNCCANLACNACCCGEECALG
jgi:hypothetical protein